jgi:hypothetical protein
MPQIIGFDQLPYFQKFGSKFGSTGVDQRPSQSVHVGGAGGTLGGIGTAPGGGGGGGGGGAGGGGGGHPTNAGTASMAGGVGVPSFCAAVNAATTSAPFKSQDS